MSGNGQHYWGTFPKCHDTVLLVYSDKWYKIGDTRCAVSSSNKERKRAQLTDELCAIFFQTCPVLRWKGLVCKCCTEYFKLRQLTKSYCVCGKTTILTHIEVTVWICFFKSEYEQNKTLCWLFNFFHLMYSKIYTEYISYNDTLIKTCLPQDLIHWSLISVSHVQLKSQVCTAKVLNYVELTVKVKKSY